jgi:hypothetical protein
MRKHFLIASFSAVSAPHLTHPLSRITHRCPRPFLFRTNKPHKIIIQPRALLKTKEKQFSIQYKFAVGSICLPAVAGNLACAHLISFGCGTNAKIQFRRAQARLPMFVARIAGHGSRSTNHKSQITNHAVSPAASKCSAASADATTSASPRNTARFFRATRQFVPR